MKHVCMLLAGAGLIAASGTIAAAEDGTTLFTPRLHGDHFVCSAINLSDKALGINIAILDDDGMGSCSYRRRAMQTPRVRSVSLPAPRPK